MEDILTFTIKDVVTAVDNGVDKLYASVLEDILK